MTRAPGRIFTATIFVAAAAAFAASTNIKLVAEPGSRVLQAGTSFRGSGGNGALSASVYGLWITHFDAAGVQLLDVLVLFRGQPGSVLGPGPHGASSGGRGANQSARVFFAGLTFTVDYVAQPAAVDVNGRHVLLADSNVLMFDHVDTARELEAPTRGRLDPHVDTGRVLFAAIANTPAILDFLRCRAPLTDPNMRRADEILCARFAGGVPTR